MSKEKTVKYKSKKFAARIINLYKFLSKEKKFILSKQILRSGTSISANIEEKQYAV